MPKQKKYIAFPQENKLQARQEDVLHEEVEDGVFRIFIHTSTASPRYLFFVAEESPPLFMSYGPSDSAILPFIATQNTLWNQS